MRRRRGVSDRAEDLDSPDRFPPREFRELAESGLLWWINRCVFHPAGFALALHPADRADLSGPVVGWSLIGDGSKPWRFDDDVVDESALLAKVRELLSPAGRDAAVEVVSVGQVGGCSEGPPGCPPSCA